MDATPKSLYVCLGDLAKLLGAICKSLYNHPNLPDHEITALIGDRFSEVQRLLLVADSIPDCPPSVRNLSLTLFDKLSTFHELNGEIPIAFEPRRQFELFELLGKHGAAWERIRDAIKTASVDSADLWSEVDRCLHAGDDLVGWTPARIEYARSTISDLRLSLRSIDEPIENNFESAFDDNGLRVNAHLHQLRELFERSGETPPIVFGDWYDEQFQKIAPQYTIQRPNCPTPDAERAQIDWTDSDSCRQSLRLILECLSACDEYLNQVVPSVARRSTDAFHHLVTRLNGIFPSPQFVTREHHDNFAQSLPEIESLVARSTSELPGKDIPPEMLQDIFEQLCNLSPPGGDGIGSTISSLNRLSVRLEAIEAKRGSETESADDERSAKLTENLRKIRSAQETVAEQRREKASRSTLVHELTQAWNHVCNCYFVDPVEFASDLKALGEQFRRWGFADRIAGYVNALRGEDHTTNTTRLFLNMLTSCCDEKCDIEVLQEKYTELWAYVAENECDCMEEVTAEVFDGIGFRETQHAIQKGVAPPTWDELRQIRSTSQSKDPGGERESKTSQPTPEHIPYTKPNANENSDDSPVPLFDPQSRDWVPADEISQKYSVQASTLADYRSATRRKGAQVDAVGFWFRSDPKKPSNEPPYYYWPQAEKVIAAKNEKKKAKTRK